MAAVSGVNIVMLPEEHAEFWAYLATTGEIWARALGDPPDETKFAPTPVAEFVERFAAELPQYHTIGLYLGERLAVLEPRTVRYPETVGGTEVVISEPGTFPIISEIRGGRKVERLYVDPAASQVLRYNFGVLAPDNTLNRTTCSFYSTYLAGKAFHRHPDAFLKWGRKVTAWLRRRRAGMVPVHRANYEIPATARAIEAGQKGMKFY